MAGGSSKANAPKARKRVDAQSGSGSGNTRLRAKDGSAFVKCEECKKDVPVVLISMHSCSLDAKIKLNLEAQVVEKPAEEKKKPVERKKPTSDAPKAKRLKKVKDKKTVSLNKPKRPPTAFFIFMSDFRKSYKEEHPDSKSPTEVVKQGGEKWKSLTDEEKKPYMEKAAELKEKYKQSLEKDDAENEEDKDAEEPVKDGDLEEEVEEEGLKEDGEGEEVADENKAEEKEEEEEEDLDDY